MAGFSLAGAILLSGCQSFMVPDPTPQTEPSNSVNIAGDRSIANLGSLINKLAETIKDYEFRQAMSSFIVSGVKPKGFEEQFNVLSELVSHDDDWDKELKSLQKLAEQDPNIVTGGKDINAYLDTLVVFHLMQPEKLDSVSNSILAEYEIDSQSIKKEGESYTWSQAGGLSIETSNGVIYDVLIPHTPQYFVNDASLVSARNITKIIDSTSDSAVRTALKDILLSVQEWISLNNSKIEPDTELESMTPEILGNITVPSVLSVNGQLSIQIVGTVNAFEIKMTSENGDMYMIDSQGNAEIQSSSNDSVSNESKLPLTIQAQALAHYRSSFEELSLKGETVNLNTLVENMNSDNPIQGSSWSLFNNSGDKYPQFVFEGKEYTFFDITNVVG